MNELLRRNLLSHAIESYQIGYLLLDSDLTIKDGNQHVRQWLTGTLPELIGKLVTEAFPELIGVEDILTGLDASSEPFRLEEVFRQSNSSSSHYSNLQVARMGHDRGELLLTTSDATRNALQEQMLQQQRNEMQLLSAELTDANEKLSYILDRLLPETVAKSLMKERGLPKPGSELIREATVLVADMRDFTIFAEVYQPSVTLDFLNTYLSIVSQAILDHEGSLVQLVGDMVMGVFNIPVDQPDHPVRAVSAALDIQQTLREFNARSDNRYPNVSFGVGIATGPVVAGYLGFQRRFRYAVVGDATNIAFHLSSLAAADRILIAETTVANAGDKIDVQEKGEFQLKRRRNLIKVFELTSSM